MKTLHKIMKITAGVFILVALAVSCIPEQESMGDAGQTLVKLFPDGFKLIPFNAVSTPQSAVLFEVRKDVHSEAALNSATSVTLKKDDSIITAYNTENETELIPLPTNLATTSPAVGGDGKVVLEFGAGDFQKGLVVNVPNATLFDFSKAYALAYRIESVSGTGVLSQNVGDEVVVQVGVKNYLDGLYNSTGTFNHPASGGEDWLQDDTYDRLFEYIGPDAKEGGTSGANSILTWAGDVGYDMNLTVLATTIAVGNKQYPQVKVDILTRPDYGQFTETQAPQTPGLPVNYYNTDTKTFVLYYYYGSAPNRRKIYEELAYKGPR